MHGLSRLVGDCPQPFPPRQAHCLWTLSCWARARSRSKGLRIKIVDITVTHVLATRCALQIRRPRTVDEVELQGHTVRWGGVEAARGLTSSSSVPAAPLAHSHRTLGTTSLWLRQFIALLPRNSLCTNNLSIEAQDARSTSEFFGNSSSGSGHFIHAYICGYCLSRDFSRLTISNLTQINL